MSVNRPSSDRLRRLLSRWEARANSGESSPTPSSDSPFRDQPRRKRAKQIEEDLDGLLQRLDDRAQQLADSPTMERLEDYRRTLADVLDLTLSLSRQTKRLTGRRSFPSTAEGSSTKEHLNVSRVDETMATLGEWIQREERDRMRLVETLGELKGLLVDVVARVRPPS